MEPEPEPQMLPGPDPEPQPEPAEPQPEPQPRPHPHVEPESKAAQPQPEPQPEPQREPAEPDPQSTEAQSEPGPRPEATGPQADDTKPELQQEPQQEPEPESNLPARNTHIPEPETVGAALAPIASRSPLLARRLDTEGSKGRSRQRTLGFNADDVGLFSQAQAKAERELQRQAAKQEDRADLLSLFQQIAEANGRDTGSQQAAAYVRTEDLALFILAMNPSRRISGEDFRALLKEFGISSSSKVRFEPFEHWWYEMGCLRIGVAASYFCVAQTGAFDLGSAAVWTKECTARIKRFEEEQAIVKLQTQVRMRQARRSYHQLKSEHSLPGSQRILVTKAQSYWRMVAGRTKFKECRLAAIAIQAHARAQIARAVYEQALLDHESDGYDLASSTVHVGGVGKQWEDDRVLAQCFATKFGAVLAANVRYRPPDLPKFPFNSWGLVTFKSPKSIGKIFAQAKVEDAGGVEAARAPPTALVSADASITFIVRTIDPTKAMTSTGAFGKTFQECRDRVKRARGALRRAEEQRRQATAFSRRRLSELAAPAMSTPQKMVMMAHSRHLVVREYADGWLYCRMERPSAGDGLQPHREGRQGADRERGRGDRGRSFYWFNTNTAESRWSAPPCLARLEKTVNLSTRQSTRAAPKPNRVTPLQPSPRLPGSTRRVGDVQPGALPVLSSAKRIYSTSLPRSPLAMQISSSGSARSANFKLPQRRQQRLPLHAAVGEAEVPPMAPTVQLPNGTGSPYQDVIHNRGGGIHNASPRARQPIFTPESPRWTGPERIAIKQPRSSPRLKHASLRPALNQQASPRRLHLDADAKVASENEQSEKQSISPKSKSARAKGRWRQSGTAILAMRKLLSQVANEEAD
eukprot:COSAG02_NODE_4963_length_4776_cov_2.041052_2_plen_865_part_00